MLIEENLKVLEKRNNEKSKDGDIEAIAAARGVDPLIQASKEKVINITDIEDPEDRIRAEEALREQNDKNARKDQQSPSIYYIGFALLIVLFGIFMK